MSRYGGERFSSHGEIPDLISPRLWVPLDYEEIRPVKLPEHTSTSTTPVEVAYCVIRLGAADIAHESRLLTLAEEGIFDLTKYLLNGDGNHVGRVMIKAMLEPERLAPIDLAATYDRERGKTWANTEQKIFFTNFVENWGVVRRD